MRLSVALASLVVASTVAVPAAAHVPISKIQVLRVSQPPYKPVVFRMSLRAPVGLRILVGYKIFDSKGRAVYHQMETKFTNPYQSTSYTLRWRKRGYDGIPVPRGRLYYVVPYAGDLDDLDGDDPRAKLIRGPAKSFTLH